MTLRTLEQADLKGAVALVRVDFNVPTQEGIVTDLTRIERVRRTIATLRARGAKIVLLSHFGRPEGQVVPALSQAFLKSAILKVFGGDVFFVPDICGEAAHSAISALEPGQILLLENLRFDPGEEANDPTFAAKIAALGTVYVNDAFSVSHRAHASVEAITHLLPSYAGCAMLEEVGALTNALDHPLRPSVAIVAGAKISTKIGILTHVLRHVDTLVLGGGIANTFLAAQGHAMGASLVEASQLDTARALLAEAAQLGKSLVLPVDLVVATACAPGVETRMVKSGEVPEGWMALDMGPESCRQIGDVLASAKTCIWNGPLGVFEVPPFDRGTRVVAMQIARLTHEGGLYSIAGGGETLAALNSAGAGADFTYLSTAGGAFLEWLEGRSLPGVRALDDHKARAQAR